MREFDSYKSAETVKDWQNLTVEELSGRLVEEENCLQTLRSSFRSPNDSMKKYRIERIAAIEKILDAKRREKEWAKKKRLNSPGNSQIKKTSDIKVVPETLPSPKELLVAELQERVIKIIKKHYLKESEKTRQQVFRL